MNDQVKVLLTIKGIEGATLHRKGYKKIPFILKKKDLYPHYKGKDKEAIIKKGYSKMYNLESVDCSKSINLSLEAYNYMTSTSLPEWYHKKDWFKLSKKARLELHLKRICEDNRGKEFIYSVLED